MEVAGPFSARINSFIEAYVALPLPRQVPAELVIISTGAVPGKWSYKHVYTVGDTYYFIFRKSDLTDMDAGWECADRELEEVAKQYTTQTEKL